MFENIDTIINTVVDWLKRTFSAIKSKIMPTPYMVEDGIKFWKELDYIAYKDKKMFEKEVATAKAEGRLHTFRYYGSSYSLQYLKYKLFDFIDIHHYKVVRVVAEEVHGLMDSELVVEYIGDGKIYVSEDSNGKGRLMVAK